MRLRKPGSSSRQPAEFAPPAAGDLALPSIWMGSFRSAAEWTAAATDRAQLGPVLDAIDDQMLSSRHPFTMHAWCAACQSVQPMSFAWHFGMVEPDGSVHPAWTETGGCPGCGLNSRMRALIDFLGSHPHPDDDGTCFTAERVTGSFPVFQRLFKEVVGSEFLGDDRVSGTSYPQSSGIDIRHEDLTALSFPDSSFGTIITQDVFEHIPDRARAFAECVRVLRPGGRMVFTIPFFPDAATTEVRATVDEHGAITHLLQPEIHGNPVGEGSLCFQHFGWDILDGLRAAGFADALAHVYWGPWQGHLGFPFFVFEARCGG